jgi:hypothetical protein
VIGLIADKYKLPLLAIALLGALAAAGGAGYQVGAMVVEADWNQEKIARADVELRTVLGAVARNEEKRQQDLAATRATLATYKRNLNEAEQRITAERAAADRLRLRIAIPARMCTLAGGAEAPGAIRADGAGAAEEIELPIQIERGLRDLAEDADREVERLSKKLAAIQEWARTHGFYEVGQ